VFNLLKTAPQRELDEPLSLSHSSCTSKAYTTLRRPLFHLYPWMLPPIPPQKPQNEELKPSPSI